MTISNSKRYFFFSLKFLILVVLILGIFFRFVNLDRKVYWHDETFTSLRISGYTVAEMVEDIFGGDVISIREIQKYQYPNDEKSLNDTLKSLAKEDPQHPPLYFVLARFWMQMFGNSVAVIRSFSAFISLLALPCVYWLCLELFEKPVFGWVAVSLFSLSPFHLLFAQEAREYVLWLVTILLSSAALMTAIRRKNNLSWLLYGVTLAIGFYSFLFTGLVAIGHGIYVVTIEKFRLTKTTIAYFLSSIVGIILFIPWLIIVSNNVGYIHDATDWTANSSGLQFLLKIWILNIAHLFLDIKFNFSNPLTYLILPIVILVGYSFYFICCQTSLKIWLFVFTLIGVTSIPLIIPDVLFGGWRSGVPRYLIPCYLGIQLSVTYLITSKITFPSMKHKYQRLWQIIAIALISCGLISCISISYAPDWWNKYSNQNYHEIAKIINQAKQPLVISDENIGNIISLSYLLESKVKLQRVTKTQAAKKNTILIPDGFDRIFLFDPSSALRSNLKNHSNYKIKLVSKIGQRQLWQVEK